MKYKNSIFSKYYLAITIKCLNVNVVCGTGNCKIYDIMLYIQVILIMFVKIYIKVDIKYIIL